MAAKGIVARLTEIQPTNSQKAEQLTDDTLHKEVYRITMKRVPALLQDKDHYMAEAGPTTVRQPGAWTEEKVTH